jgi:hypothetical protein
MTEEQLKRAAEIYEAMRVLDRIEHVSRADQWISTGSVQFVICNSELAASLIRWIPSELARLKEEAEKL